ncbi:hypothetical protein BGX27_002486 [Mortierella sp. AM989]|nr:hypothetical protein BGX27_002486 [Mortierella sp. AM989]
MSNDWRRQKVESHKFDFIDVDDYIDNSLWRKFKYSLVFAIVIKGILIYCADLWTGVNLLLTDTWSTSLGVQDGRISLSTINISFEIYKWIFAACIILSFILLAWDMKKAAAIIKSRDISYAFTSMIAYRYYAIKSYAHFCLFEKIHNSKKQIDEVAFFCFFTFRGWKRLMFADGPRQVINGIVLITVVTKNKKDGQFDFEFWNYNMRPINLVTMGLMTFTLTLWVISVMLMIVAVVLYIPLVIHIKGNLKEFCCHKIDKRIDEIIKKKAKLRAYEAKSGKGGKGGEAPLQKPTLPQISLMEEGKPPMTSSTPRMAAIPSPYMASGSPGLRKNMPVVNDPYRHYRPPRPYTPTQDDDSDTKPLRQNNYQQAYHNRNLQHYDYGDDRSEISDSAYSHNGYMAPKYPQVSHPGHRKQPSDTSTVLSGSNQGSVVSGYGPRTARSHPLQQGHIAHYGETARMNNLGQRSAPSPYNGYL